MKKTVYFFALLLVLNLYGCGNVSDANVTSSPAPTIKVMPEATAKVSPEISSDNSDDNGMMTSGSVASPSPMPSTSPSPDVNDAESTSSPAPTDSSSK